MRRIAILEGELADGIRRGRVRPVRSAAGRIALDSTGVYQSVYPLPWMRPVRDTCHFPPGCNASRVPCWRSGTRRNPPGVPRTTRKNKGGKKQARKALERDRISIVPPTRKDNRHARVAPHVVHHHLHHHHRSQRASCQPATARRPSLPLFAHSLSPLLPPRPPRVPRLRRQRSLDNPQRSSATSSRSPTRLRAPLSSAPTRRIRRSCSLACVRLHLRPPPPPPPPVRLVGRRPEPPQTPPPKPQPRRREDANRHAVPRAPQLRSPVLCPRRRRTGGVTRPSAIGWRAVRRARKRKQRKQSTEIGIVNGYPAHAREERYVALRPADPDRAGRRSGQRADFCASEDCDPASRGRETNPRPRGRHASTAVPPARSLARPRAKALFSRRQRSAAINPLDRQGEGEGRPEDRRMNDRRRKEEKEEGAAIT